MHWTWMVYCVRVKPFVSTLPRVVKMITEVAVVTEVVAVVVIGAAAEAEGVNEVAVVDSKVHFSNINNHL